MRILTVGNMYPPHSLGGYEVIWRSWVLHARAQGHDVRVLTTDFRLDSGPDATELDDWPVCRELRWYWRDHRFPRLSPWARLALENHNASVLEQHLADLKPDVVVWWNMAGMSNGMIERVRRNGVPAVAVLGNYWLEYGPKADGWLRMFLGRPRLAKLGERLTGAITQVDLASSLTAVFISDKVRQGATKASPEFAASQVLYHEPDLELFQPVPAPPWSWKLLFLGRVDHEKGTDLAIRALEHLPPSATLSVVGGGNSEYSAELKQLTRELGLEERVSFEEPAHRETAPAYVASDVVVFPVRWNEPWGLVPCEAMAVGRPVVASGRGGSGEYLCDGENCLLFNPDNGPTELAARVRDLAADQTLRARLIEGGKRTVAKLSESSFDATLQAIIDGAAVQARKSRR